MLFQCIFCISERACEYSCQAEIDAPAYRSSRVQSCRDPDIQGPTVADRQTVCTPAPKHEHLGQDADKQFWADSNGISRTLLPRRWNHLLRRNTRLCRHLTRSRKRKGGGSVPVQSRKSMHVQNFQSRWIQFQEPDRACMHEFVTCCVCVCARAHACMRFFFGKTGQTLPGFGSVFKRRYARDSEGLSLSVMCWRCKDTVLLIGVLDKKRDRALLWCATNAKKSSLNSVLGMKMSRNFFQYTTDGMEQIPLMVC